MAGRTEGHCYNSCQCLPLLAVWSDFFQRLEQVCQVVGPQGTIWCLHPSAPALQLALHCQACMEIHHAGEGGRNQRGRLCASLSRGPCTTVRLDVGLARVSFVGGFRNHREVRSFLRRNDPHSARDLACASPSDVWSTVKGGKAAFSKGRGFWISLEFSDSG